MLSGHPHLIEAGATKLPATVMKIGELKDYYGLMGVSRSATVSEIHKAYWRQASRCHPDRGGSHESMVRLIEAWKILSDPNKRARYDQLLKYRGDGWHSRKFDEDVLDARKGAESYTSSSWAEFEETYQKAFYTFNRDFYGEEIDSKAAGPYSPLMGSQVVRNGATTRFKPDVRVTGSGKTGIFTYVIKTVILLSAVAVSLIMYREFSGVGRYVPLNYNATGMQILDTSTGSVYSVENRKGSHSSPWREVVPPAPRDKRWPAK